MQDKPIVRFLDRTTPPHVATLILMAGVGALSLSIFLPSLPAMAAYFGVEYGAMQVTVSLYLLGTALVQIAIGPISDRYGRRPVVLVAGGMFVLASIGCVYAPNYGVFLAFRLLQTSIATAFVISRAIVRDMVPQAQAASMIGYVTMGMSVVPMIGPAVGGALSEAFNWQASFWLLAVSGILLTTLAFFDQGETHRSSGGSFADQVRTYPALLTSQRFWAYNLAAAFASGAFFAYLGGAPFVGSDSFGMEPAELGLYFGAPAIGYLVGNGLSGRFSVRVGVNRMVLFGALCTLTGMSTLALLTLAGATTPLVFFSFMITVGLGNGILLPNATSGMLSIKPELAGSAAGLGGAFMIGGGAALSALASVVLRPGAGPMPLVLVMLGTCLASVCCALWVIRRDRHLGL
ncbi:MAG: multidrug effflux MFS transporter [Octadecabacter sp.]|nr:multidrug effflux MFS transporter [Octadecabacter sp.]